MASTPAGALGSFQISGDIAVAIPDHTRPVDVRPALQALAERLHGKMQVVVGLGLHRRMNSGELSALKPWKVVQHDPDDCLPTCEVDGIPGKVFRLVLEADWSVSIGIAELHQYAGVSGGHKGVAVGCGGRETIRALHHRDRVCSPGVVLGAVQGNPFRGCVDALGKAARCRLALVYVPAVRQWLAGDPVQVIKHASELIDPWTWVDTPAAGAVLRIPQSKGVSLYQASRAATYLALSPRPAVKAGGTLVIEAPMSEGLGSESGFVEALHRFSPPWTELLTGDIPQGAGAQRGIMLALMGQRYRLVLWGCKQPETFRRLGIEAHHKSFALPNNWLEVRQPFGCIPQLRSGGGRSE